jgi:hypothetical protein
MNIRGSFPGVKRKGREANRSPPLSAEIKNGGDLPLIPIIIHGVLLN